MEKRAQIVSILVLLGLSGIFSIEVFADSDLDSRIQSDYDTISEYQSSGAINPNTAEQLRLEVAGVEQDEANALLPMFPAKRQQIVNELDQVEQDIQTASSQ